MSPYFAWGSSTRYFSQTKKVLCLLEIIRVPKTAGFVFFSFCSIKKKKNYYRKIAVKYCISTISYSIYKYWLECHGNKTIQQLQNLVTRIKSYLHYHLRI